MAKADQIPTERLIGQALLFSGLGLLGLELTAGRSQVLPLLVPASMAVGGIFILESDHDQPRGIRPARRRRRRS